MRIAIVGAGIAGPALAYWLHRGGHEIALIEKAPSFRRGGYIIDFWGVGYTVAQRMGILSDVRKAGYSVREVRIVDEHNRKVGGFYADIFRRITNDQFTSLPRSDLATAIYRSVEGRVETMFGHSVAAIDERSTDIVIFFEHGGSRNFDLVVGADGLHSRVRELAFGPEGQFETYLGYHVAAFQVEGYHPRDELVYVSYAEPGRQIARFSLRDDRTMFLFVFVSENVPGPQPCDRKARLHQAFADVGWECPQILRAMDQVEDIYFDRVSQIRMDRWSNGRVILIGDAAACVSLLAGEGAGLAMTAAYVLAGELNRAGDDYRDATRRYEQLLRPFIEKKQKSAQNFAGAFAPKTRIGVWFRNQVTRLFAIPTIADYFVGRDLTDDFALPEYEVQPVAARRR